MEEPTCTTSCLICESQFCPTNHGNETDTRDSISILKNLLLQQNEAYVKCEKEKSEAIQLFCPACAQILNEWHEIQGLMSNLLVRSKSIKNRLIANILGSNVTLPGQLQDSAALQELLEDFSAVKRAVINEYRPSLQLERLAEIPFDALRNCFGNDGQNDEPEDLLDNSAGFEHEDHHDDWEAPTFDAAESIEFHDDGSDQLNRNSSSISRHVMTTRKRKRSPTEQCDGRNPKENRIEETDDTSRRTRRNPGNQTPGTDVLHETLKPKAGEKRKKRSVVHLDNGDILYDGKYNVKCSGNMYFCQLCGRKRKGMYSMIEHIREDHIRAKADEKRKKRSVVELPNRDILYDGKYTLKWCGNKYLCPVCGLQRKRKHSMTEHILEGHIRGGGTDDITGVGDYTFLYLKRYGFTFSKNRYKCTTCGINENKRRFLIDHIRVSHVNGADQAKDVSKIIDQPEVPSSSLDVNEPESATDADSPDRNHPESSDSEEESEEDSDDGQDEPVTEGINNPPSGPRSSFRFVEIAENVFMYAGKYRIVLKNGRYKCPKCPTKRRQKFAITQHMREKHMKCVVSQKVRPFNRIVAINENEFMYGGKYRMTRIQNRFFCSECPASRPTVISLTEHIRQEHIRNKDQTTDVSKATGPSSSLVDEEDVGEAEIVENAEHDPDFHHSESRDGEVEHETLPTETDNETSQVNVLQGTLIPETEKAGRKKRTVVELDHGDILYDGKYTIKWCGNKYLCPLCGLQRKEKCKMIGHIREDHIRGKGTNEIIGVGQNTFLYLNQYGFTFSKNRYKCTTCGITLANRLYLTNHIQAYHINGREKTKSMDVSKKVKGQAKAPSSSLVESEDVSEPEGEENTEEDPDWHHPESSDSEVENETLQTETDNQTSEGDVLQEALDQADKPGRKRRFVVTLDNGDIIYGGKYTIRLYGKKYLCPLCALQRSKKHAMTEHILGDHIRGKGSNEITSLGENTFLYLNQYGFTFSDNQYKCTTCGVALAKRSNLIDHIQVCHVNGVEPLLAPETSTIENSQPEDIQLPPEVSETCTIETSQPEDAQLPPEVSETCTVETSQPEETQLSLHVQPLFDATETIKAIQSIKCEAVKRDAVHIEQENQSSEKNVQMKTFNVESHDETEENKRIKRTVVVLENGDVLYDGKYNIKLYGKKYLCPVCGLQRNRKYGITEHIRVDHILANPPTTPEITAVGENSFLYLNQYGFSCTNNWYKCTTCGITLSLRHLLLNHIQVSHVNGGTDKAIVVGKGQAQPKAQSSSLENANEPESVENAEEDPDWHQTDSSDSEAQSEKDSDDDEEQSVGRDTNNPPSSPRKTFKFIPINKNVFLYADKYRIVLKGGLYKCPKCSCMRNQKFAIMQHIRAKHMKRVVSQNVRPFNKIVTISENEFVYGGKYRITKMKNRFFCSECPASRTTVASLSEHIRREHIRNNEVPEATPETEGQSGKANTGSHKLTKLGPNEYLYGGQVRISIKGGMYTCGSCGVQRKTLTLMRGHAAQIHIQRATDEFFKSVQPLEDGTLKCGKCDYIGKNWDRMKEHIRCHKNSLKNTGSAELRKYNFSVEVSPNHFDHGGWPYRFVTETGRYNCGSCNFTFRTQRKTVRHIGMYHRNPVETAMCEECGKTFANKDSLRSHKARHRPKTVPCPECGKLFVKQEDVKGHMKTHLGEAAKTQVCEFCGKGFYKLNQLEKHRATHTGEAPYSCDDCGLGYYTQRELKNHQKTKHPKETASSNDVPPVDTNDAVVSIEIVDGVITDISSM